jgi:hypothetical protein
MPDLVDLTIFVFFQKLDTGCHWYFCPCHVAIPNWAMWKPLIHPCHPLPCEPVVSEPRHYMDAMSLPTHHSTSLCHVTVRTVWTTTWKNPIGPRIGLEVPNLGDTWQPLVLPRHHDDVSMTRSTFFSFHVYCMNVDIIHTDVDVNSMDVYSSPVD